MPGATLTGTQRGCLPTTDSNSFGRIQVAPHLFLVAHESLLIAKA
jgi:hypothetical protein